MEELVMSPKPPENPEPALGQHWVPILAQGSLKNTILMIFEISVSLLTHHPVKPSSHTVNTFFNQYLQSKVSFWRCKSSDMLEGDAVTAVIKDHRLFLVHLIHKIHAFARWKNVGKTASGPLWNPIHYDNSLVLQGYGLWQLWPYYTGLFVSKNPDLGKDNPPVTLLSQQSGLWTKWYHFLLWNPPKIGCIHDQSIHIAFKSLCLSTSSYLLQLTIREKNSIRKNPPL